MPHADRQAVAGPFGDDVLREILCPFDLTTASERPEQIIPGLNFSPFDGRVQNAAGIAVDLDVQDPPAAHFSVFHGRQKQIHQLGRDGDLPTFMPCVMLGLRAADVEAVRFKVDISPRQQVGFTGSPQPRITGQAKEKLVLHIGKCIDDGIGIIRGQESFVLGCGGPAMQMLERVGRDQVATPGFLEEGLRIANVALDRGRRERCVGSVGHLVRQPGAKLGSIFGRDRSQGSLCPEKTHELLGCQFECVLAPGLYIGAFIDQRVEPPFQFMTLATWNQAGLGDARVHEVREVVQPLQGLLFGGLPCQRSGHQFLDIALDALGILDWDGSKPHAVSLAIGISEKDAAATIVLSLN